MKRYDSEDGAMVPHSEGVFVFHEEACASLKHMREHFEAKLAARDKRIAELEAANASLTDALTEYEDGELRDKRIKELEAENKELRRIVALAKDAYQASGGPNGERSLRVLWDALGMP